MKLNVENIELAKKGLKRCAKCGEILPADTEHFNKTVRNADGLSSYCTKCNREYLANYRPKRAAATSELPTDEEKVKTCPRCGRTLPLSAFYLNASTRDGHACYCRECRVEYSRAYGRKRRADADTDGLVLSGYSDQALYDELYRRGYRGRLTRPHYLGEATSYRDRAAKSPGIEFTGDLFKSSTMKK